MASCRKHLPGRQNKHDGSHHAAGSPSVGLGTAGGGGGEGKTLRSALRAGASSLLTHTHKHTQCKSTLYTNMDLRVRVRRTFKSPVCSSHFIEVDTEVQSRPENRPQSQRQWTAG